MLSRWIRNCCWRDINIWCVVGENDTIRRNLIECNFKQERSRFCLSFLSRGWASVLSAYRPRQRGMNLFNRDSYFFQKQKITTLPFFFFFIIWIIYNLNFVKLRTILLLKRKYSTLICIGITITLKRNRRYFEHQH